MDERLHTKRGDERPVLRQSSVADSRQRRGKGGIIITIGRKHAVDDS